MEKYLNYAGLVTVLKNLKKVITTEVTQTVESALAKLPVFTKNANGLVPSSKEASTTAVLTADGKWTELAVASTEVGSIPVKSTGANDSIEEAFTTADFNNLTFSE